MKTLIFLILLFVNFILKSAVLVNFLPSTLIFNTTLCIIVCLALLARKREGLAWTIFIAILNDLFYHEVLFLNLFLFTIIYLAIFLFRENINMENLLSIAIVNILTYIFYIIVSYILLSFMNVDVIFKQVIKNIFSLKIILIAIYGIFMYLISKRIFRYKNYDI